MTQTTSRPTTGKCVNCGETIDQLPVQGTITFYTWVHRYGGYRGCENGQTVARWAGTHQLPLHEMIARGTADPGPDYPAALAALELAARPAYTGRHRMAGAL